MAGNGPAPKGARSRARDTAVRDVVKSDGKIGGTELPEGVLGKDKDGNDVAWHPVTLQWWDDWRESPQGVRMITNVDWGFLLDTALMHHNMWANGRWDFAAEVRLRVAKFGATPEDRARLKIEIEIPEQYQAGNSGNGTNVTAIGDRRSRIAGG